jgi:hypothetical protein
MGLPERMAERCIVVEMLAEVLAVEDLLLCAFLATRWGLKYPLVGHPLREEH